MLLQQQHGWVVVGEAEDMSELLTFKANISPDLVILDGDLLRHRDNNSIMLIRELFPGIRIIIMLDPQNSVQNPLLAEVDGFATKVKSPENLLSAIRNANTRNYDD